MEKCMEKITEEEVRNHNKRGEDSWVIIQGNVYDITNIENESLFEGFEGKDATSFFFRKLDYPFKILKQMEEFKIGVLEKEEEEGDYESEKEKENHGCFIEEIDPKKSLVVLEKLQDDKRKNWNFGFFLGGISVIFVYGVFKGVSVLWRKKIEQIEGKV